MHVFWNYVWFNRDINYHGIGRDVELFVLTVSKAIVQRWLMNKLRVYDVGLFSRI